MTESHAHHRTQHDPQDASQHDSQQSPQHDYLVFIGRFQPFHVGHRFVISEALQRAKTVIVLIGSANLPRTLRNPFSVAERTAMILGAFDPSEAKRIRCVPLDDALYNDVRWLQYVQQAVGSVTGDVSADIALIGHAKDNSSYYLSLFPQWHFVAVESYHDLSATPLRDGYLAGDTKVANVPTATQTILDSFATSPDYQRLHAEYHLVAEHKQRWLDTPYPPTFVTVDALVVQAGHILLIERGGDYGKGLWALPGGFVDPKETLFDACVRELLEETCLNVSKATLKSSRHSQHTFDDPYRSARGRTITQVYYFALKNDPEGLPRVQGNDDAARAFWLPLAALDAKQMFEDHYAIIVKMLGL